MRNFDRGDFRRNDRPKELHKTKCSKCDKECEVPFKPSGDRPVYCRECFAKQKQNSDRRFAA